MLLKLLQNIAGTTRLLSPSSQLRLSCATIPFLMEATGLALSSYPCFLQSTVARGSLREPKSGHVTRLLRSPGALHSVLFSLHVFGSLLYRQSPCDPQRFTTSLPSACTLAQAQLSLPDFEALGSTLLTGLQLPSTPLFPPFIPAPLLIVRLQVHPVPLNAWAFCRWRRSYFLVQRN